MNIVGALRELIVGSTSVTNLLASASSVYPVVLPQSYTCPAVTIMIADDRPDKHKHNVSPNDNVEVVVRIFGKTYDSVQKIDTEIRGVIEGYAGTVTTTLDSVSHRFYDIAFANRNDDYDPTNDLFVRVVTYKAIYSLA